MTEKNNKAFQSIPLSQIVEQHVRQYIEALDGDMPSNFHELIISEVEKPLINVVLETTNGNVSKSASILGLNRGTLRKKLLQYNIR